MKPASSTPYAVGSISEQHHFLSLPAPEHPLVSVINFKDAQALPELPEAVPFTLGFYSITIKQNCDCKLKYGRAHYDFDRGVMSFVAPNQLLTLEPGFTMARAGWMLAFHPDFIRNHPLGGKIKEYGFFSYAVAEALHLSPAEERMMEGLMKAIRKEYRSAIDDYTQDVILSQIETLLNYAARFYNRQFITRKPATHDLLARVETLIAQHIAGSGAQDAGLPTVRRIAEGMAMSPNYLGDALKKLTGQSTQYHIHRALMERAKDKLTTSDLSVSEIAYGLGFEAPQSFSKLFKQKEGVTPLAYRASFDRARDAHRLN